MVALPVQLRNSDEKGIPGKGLEEELITKGIFDQRWD
jgi:hypothetical protein